MDIRWAELLLDASGHETAQSCAEAMLEAMSIRRSVPPSQQTVPPIVHPVAPVRDRLAEALLDMAARLNTKTLPAAQIKSPPRASRPAGASSVCVRLAAGRRVVMVTSRSAQLGLTLPVRTPRNLAAHPPSA